MSQILLAQANSLHVPLADQSVSMICTSPPYFGVRDYGTGTWVGGDPLHEHAQIAARNGRGGSGSPGKQTPNTYPSTFAAATCSCGAVRRDEQLGLEQVHDCNGAFTGQNCGQCYICHMRAVAKELWRVLRNDGTLWINIGDSYASGWPCRRRSQIGEGSLPNGKREARPPRLGPGLKDKSLCGIPQRLALALQSDGWVWRSDIIWEKPSCMPESVQDRPTRSHEYILLFSKQARYFWDGVAIAEDSALATSTSGYHRQRRLSDAHQRTRPAHANRIHYGTLSEQAGILCPSTGRNSRTVWTIPSEPFTGGHYAAFPTALAEKMVRAGSSERGVCSQCGAPWVRVVQPTGTIIRQRNGGPGTDHYHSQATGHYGATSSFTTGVSPEKQTAGWRPTCPHSEAAVVPAIVLDPFAGSGTTGLAARALGRQAVLLDLSWPYLATIARERLGLAALARWHGEAAGPAPVRYDDLPLFA